MGMDVMGRDPTSEEGEYFRNNVWWWHPLWDYCCMVFPRCRNISGHTNDGEGLGSRDSQVLAKKLREQIATGATQAYAERYEARLAQLPDETCKHCNGTGIRTDEVGIANNMTDKVITKEDEEFVNKKFLPHPRLGQKGWCNACHGVGKRRNFDTSYPFSVENVEKFATFLEGCGGFRIC